MQVELRPVGLDQIAERVLIPALASSRRSVVTAPILASAPDALHSHPDRPGPRRGGVYTDKNGTRTGKDLQMLLKDKVAVIYGAGGAIGGAVARVRVRGRRRLPHRALPGARRARRQGDQPPEDPPTRPRSTPSTSRPSTTTSYEEVALDRLDISFDAIGIPNDTILGVPLVDLDLERLPADHDPRDVVLPDRAPGRAAHDPRRSGVIMTVTASHSRTGIPLVGGYGRRRPSRSRSRGASPPSSRRTASAWSAFDRKRCRRRTRSGRPTSRAPRRRG